MANRTVFSFTIICLIISGHTSSAKPLIGEMLKCVGCKLQTCPLNPCNYCLFNARLPFDLCCPFSPCPDRKCPSPCPSLPISPCPSPNYPCPCPNPCYPDASQSFSMSLPSVSLGCPYTNPCF